MPKKYEELGTSETARLFYAFSHAAVKGLGKVAFGLRSIGVSNVPQEGPGLILSNHLDWIDVALEPVVIPNRSVTVIGREGVMNKPVQGKLFELWGAKKIHRLASGERNKEAMDAGMEIMRTPLKEGHLELLYGSPPSRTPGHKPAMPMGTAARLARETGAPVIPTVIKGSEHKLRPRGITVAFGEPLIHDGTKKDDKAFRQEIHRVQTEMFEAIEYPIEYLTPEENYILAPDL